MSCSSLTRLFRIAEPDNRLSPKRRGRRCNAHAVSPFWGQVPDVILSTILVIGIGTDTKRLQHTISMQTVGWRHPKGQGIVLWSSGCKSLLFNVIRVETTIRLLRTGKNRHPLGCGSMSNHRKKKESDKSYLPLNYNYVKTKKGVAGYLIREPNNVMYSQNETELSQKLWAYNIQQIHRGKHFRR